ncbi:1,4-dihydroxy-2-naphthoate octaprenyltransferase [Aurantibacter crassamenti]|uniref:1,4-dihydroxy-2-naphthoate octaprenyltransferase n=1 Tax=Aurantibacter crassamenti TaxID=1837375 RepID=UPI00193A5313|nr:1,4-dihydroxy-2-naphthoate octaprenyltransferase [Aurantibacter crassamenti]MBM1107419.1 1,4-dihydroxy-2-naphthoate octaprenyltransferase [Aurantibacter crassamenti]
MMKIKAWLYAARLRTLPLSVSGIIVGTAVAKYHGKSDTLIFILALLTTIGFQITSNFANDYGDGVKGTDNDTRIGPKRALQGGLLSRKELKNGILISIIISLIFVGTLVYTAFGHQKLEYIVLFSILGILSIWAAIKYTVGDSAYGYLGFGDLFVFLFFGLLAVLGSMFLYANFITLIALLPATAIGLLCTAVLNLNNLRDYETDKKSQKNTLVVLMGFENAKKYHYTLLLISFLCIIFYMFLSFENWLIYIPLLAFVPIFVHLKKVYNIKEPVKLDPELKKLALSTFFLSVLIFISCYYKI